MLLEWFGFHWDIAYHADKGREGFLALPHDLIIAGIAGALLVSVVALTRHGRTLREGVRERPGMALLGASVVMTGITLGFDDWTHRQFGLDIAVWSPAHIVLTMTMVMAMLGVLIDHAGSPRSTNRSIALFHGIFLAVTTIYLFEYDYGFPHYRAGWAIVATAALFAFSIGSARASTGWRWTGTTVALTAVGMRVAAIGLNVALDRSLPAPPLGFLAGGVVHDLIMLRTGSRVRSVIAGLAAWEAVAAVQVPWLRATGKVWWPDEALVLGIVLGGLAALAAGWLGSGVGRYLIASRPRVEMPRPRMRVIAVVAAATLFAAGTVATSDILWSSPGPRRTISYAVEEGQARVVIPGSRATDWVSVIGPRDQIGLFDPKIRQAGPRAILLFPSFIPGEVAGPRLRTLRSFPLEAPRSWLGALEWRDGAFEGPIGGSGEYVGIWYVDGDGVWNSIVERGTEGRVELAQRSFAPPVRASFAFPLGIAAVVLLAFLEFAICAWCLGRAARNRAGGGKDRRQEGPPIAPNIEV